MKGSPPALATWIFKHFVLGRRNEALEGDLFEEFQRRLSAGWYWRQVLRAVLLSYSNTLGAGWAVIWTVLFAGFWVYGLCELTPLSDHWLHSEHYIPYPYWMAVGVLCYVAVPLAIYLTLRRQLNLQAFAVGLGVGAAGQMIIFFAFRPLPFVHFTYRLLDSYSGYFVSHARAAHWSVQVWGQWCLLFPPLLAAIGATKVTRSVLRWLPGTVASTFKNIMLGINHE